MSADLIVALGPWLTVALIVAVAVTAMSALGARSLFVMCLALAAMSALAASVLAMSGGDGALTLATFGVAMAPVLLLGGLLLSTRAAKPARRGAPWLSLLAAGVAAAAIIAIAPELEAAPRLSGSATSAPIGFWLTVFVFVAAIACAGLLGYGERGVLERKLPERDT